MLRRRFTQKIITLPLNIVGSFEELEGRPAEEWFATGDPGKPLGSGGGTAHALMAAWLASDCSDFDQWLVEGRRMVIHAGGQSRRLPAYAAVGKALMPIPALRGKPGQRPDQSLVDLQTGIYEDLYARAPERLRVMIVSGDALLRPVRWPAALPDGDVVCIGLRADADVAANFGAFFVSHQNPNGVDFFLQKPAPALTRDLMVDYDCLLDTGIWLLSAEAVRVLLGKCDVISPTPIAELKEYDLYSDFGPALGTSPKFDDPEINALHAEIVPVPGEFFHFGTSRQLIDSVTRLHDQAHHSAPLGFLTSAKRRSDMHAQNALLDVAASLVPDGHYWIENSVIPSVWRLAGDNVVTGIPPSLAGIVQAAVHLPRGACLDLVPVGETDFCVRVYGIDDPFKGPIAAPATQFLGAPLVDWLAARGLTTDDVAAPETDIQRAPLFPVVSADQLTPDLIAWMTGPLEPAEPTPRPRETWLAARRLSAADLLSQANVDRLYRQRRELLARSLTRMRENHRVSAFYSLDLERTAEILHRELPDYQPAPIDVGESLVKQMHDRMFRSALLRLRGDDAWRAAEAGSFAALRGAILAATPIAPLPTCGVTHDQIVWGRSSLRFDLAGGWTDTPPYCLLNGGRVLNLAVNLNGQPPVQVFLRRSDRPYILLRSIDLGTELRIESFDQLSSDLTEKSEFSLAQAALGLAGFGATSNQPDLAAALRHFGGGIEMSLLAAVPKGSGLGTSSILASTILAALSEFCCLDWSEPDILARTLALEQILGTGGGWQDQAGGCLPGVKEVETLPGLAQTATFRWLPDRLLGPDYANTVALLYYTGITRVAKSVLHEIVRGMFLNSGPRLDTLRRIGENVGPTADAIRRHDWSALGLAIRHSWQLNQELDSGTNPPAVQAILSRVEDYLLGAKLLGAGGGGFLLMFAKDPESALRVRQLLAATPPSAKARFGDFSVSPVGMEVTKS